MSVYSRAHYHNSFPVERCDLVGLILRRQRPFSETRAFLSRCHCRSRNWNLLTGVLLTAAETQYRCNLSCAVADEPAGESGAIYADLLPRGMGKRRCWGDPVC